MRAKIVNKLVVNWAASFLSVALLLSMMAAPALATFAATVDSAAIVDGSIRTRDIKRGAINSSRIRDYSIKKEDIHSGSINKYKLISGSVNTYKIKDGTIKDADVSASAAISDSKIGYSTKTRHYSIAPATFGPAGVADDGSSFVPSIPNHFAPVNLPDGVTVTKLALAAYEQSAGGDATATLMRTDMSENVGTLVSVSTTGTGAAPREFNSSAVTNPVIDNANYSYYVRFNGQSVGARLVGVFITYQVTGP